MGVPASEVGYTSAMPRKEDHEVRKGHVGALDIKKIYFFSLYEGVLIRPLPDQLPDVVGRNRECLWKEGYVLVPNCKSFIVTEAEKEHVRRRARLKQH